jgi:Ser/Thr protein kinase RdoA (MazF antagonist)
MQTSEENARSAAKEFCFDSEIVALFPYGHGHINSTFLVRTKKRYILQRLNKEIFPHSKETMENLVAVTQYLEKVIPEERRQGLQSLQEPLQLVKTKRGGFAYRDSEGFYWRAYLCHENSESFDTPQNKKELYEAGKAFGTFLYFLRDFPAETLYPTIPHFHDTPKRYQDFLAAVEQDPLKRKADCLADIAYLKSKASFYPLIEEKLHSGALPLRVTHNDTKFNNLLFDDDSDEVLTVLDLDTVMSGSLLYDFGDACRSGCSSVDESEKDLSKVSFDLARFERFSKGYLYGSHGALTPEERDLMSESVLLLALELSLRFLGDYLLGDIYFGAKEPKENLWRAENQLTLAKDIEKKLPEMKRILSGKNVC